MKRAPWSETDVAAAAMAWLQDRGWDCYPEAQFQRESGRADIAAVLGRRLTIVEAKTSATMTVLDQAARWIGKAHFVWIATPVDPGDTVRWICETRGIGIMFVRREKLWEPETGHGFVHYVDDVQPATGAYFWSSTGGRQRYGSMAAPLHRFARAADLIAGLHPDMKRATAGMQAKRGGYSTPFSRTIDAAREFVTRNPGCTIKEMVAGISHHYASDAGARSSLMAWVAKFARVDGSRLFPLNEAKAA
jgi:hypothetical protein